MSWLSVLIDRYWRYVLKGQALEALDDLSYQFQNGSLTLIEDAKDWLCDEIQSKRKVPGELRRWACSIVRDIEARDLVAWLSRTRAVVIRW